MPQRKKRSHGGKRKSERDGAEGGIRRAPLRFVPPRTRELVSVWLAASRLRGAGGREPWPSPGAGTPATKAEGRAGERPAFREGSTQLLGGLLLLFRRRSLSFQALDPDALFLKILVAIGLLGLDPLQAFVGLTVIDTSQGSCYVNELPQGPGASPRLPEHHPLLPRPQDQVSGQADQRQTDQQREDPRAVELRLGSQDEAPKPGLGTDELANEGLGRSARASSGII